MVLTYSAPCFSGECRFCASCCDSDPTSSDPEPIQRADDLIKFMGKQRVQEESDHYHKSLNKIIKQYDYRSPTDIGFMTKKVNYEKGQPIDNIKYKLIEKNHDSVCDDPLCKVFFVTSHDNLKNTFYPKVPIYKRVIDDNHQLCAVCISR